MTGGETQPSPQDVMRDQKLQRNLKLVVIVLGLFIVAGLGAIIVRVVGLGAGKSGLTANQSAKSLAASPSEGPIALELPKGAHVVSISLSGNRLAVHHDGPGGAGISILDLETGRRVLDIRPVEASPHN